MIEINNLVFPLILGYAELHYHLKWLYPKYFIDQPEIVADCPIRCILSQSTSLPILLIIKDSHKFPIRLQSIQIKIQGQPQTVEYSFSKELDISDPYYSEIFYCAVDTFKPEQILHINLKATIMMNGKKLEISQDNFPGITKNKFNCYLSSAALPYPDNWYAGDPHYHSIYTNDQVEFGADINSTKIMAKSMGLDWFFVTDHSYDLDDSWDDCTKNDSELPKWKQMKKDCLEVDEKDFRVIAGEEVSIGNSWEENVHLLVINKPEFIEGSGDSAERWFRNKPQNLITDLLLPGEDQLYIAAHPAEEVPFMQRVTLRRGSWNNDDFDKNKLEFIQVINSAEPEAIEKSINFWREHLLLHRKLYILAGNDAHGNFNSMRQIGRPFLKLFSSQKQIFGNYHTVFYHNENDPIAGIRNKRMIVTNGPFIDFSITTQTQRYEIGMDFESNVAILEYETKINKEFGEIVEVVLYLGKQRREVSINNPDNFIQLDLTSVNYLRMSLKTSLNYRAFTNPIFRNN